MPQNCLPVRYGSRSFAMRHKYVTSAIVLARTPLAESASLVTVLTEEFGLLRARAEGLRKPGAKLAHALQTLDRSEITLVRGKEAWRLSGAVLEESTFSVLSRAQRLRAGRVAGLLLRLVRGEANDPMLFIIFSGFLEQLPSLSEESQDALECFTALRILASLGLYAGTLPDIDTHEPLTEEARRAIVTRINRGILASGL